MDRILPLLEETDAGKITIKTMAESVARLTEFPDLLG